VTTPSSGHPSLKRRGALRKQLCCSLGENGFMKFRIEEKINIVAQIAPSLKKGRWIRREPETEGAVLETKHPSKRQSLL